MQKFKKTAKQAEAVRLFGKNETVLLEGGARSGKTYIALRAQCIRRMQYPNTDGLAARLRLSHARSSIWMQTLPRVLRDLGIYNRVKMVGGHDLYVRFPHAKGESRLWIDGLDDNDRIEKILGREYADVFLNEASQLSFDAYETVVTRVNPPRGVKRRIIIDYNPPSIRHWGYQIFHTRKYPDGRPVPNNDFAWLKMNPMDNVKNLNEGFIAGLDNLSISKRKRFRDGEYGTEEGALWDREWIKYGTPPETLIRVVVGVDPSGSSAGDEVGIVVAGQDENLKYWVLADYSLQGSPREWREEVIRAYTDYKADVIVAEKNYGGEMVEAVITDMGRSDVNVQMVDATRGKAVRAEPISAKYEQGDVYHAKEFVSLEDEFCTWKPDLDKDSPNRLDAAVWALTELAGTGGGGDSWIG